MMSCNQSVVSIIANTLQPGQAIMAVSCRQVTTSCHFPRRLVKSTCQLICNFVRTSWQCHGSLVNSSIHLLCSMTEVSCQCPRNLVKLSCQLIFNLVRTSWQWLVSFHVGRDIMAVSSSPGQIIMSVNLQFSPIITSVSLWHGQIIMAVTSFLAVWSTHHGSVLSDESDDYVSFFASWSGHHGSGQFL